MKTLFLNWKLYSKNEYFIPKIEKFICSKCLLNGKMAERVILEGLIDKKVEAVLRLFFRHRNELFHINKVSDGSGVPLATAFRIVKKLVKLGIIAPIEVGKFKVYKLNLTKNTQLLMGLMK